MSQKAILFIILLIFILCVGMWRYAVLWHAEQLVVTKAIEPVILDDPKRDLPAGVLLTESFNFPVPNSAPTELVRHTIPLEEIRRGCVRQDCIPSIDLPEFVPATELSDVLATSSLGIVIWDANRFYPFPMLETHELVNDTLPDGSAALISYCPLCGTGIVFDRQINGRVEEFGVSGMLWQSNLLMYNRAADVEARNLWSQILGQAVVGNRAGEPLEVLPSDIITYGKWLAVAPAGETLVTGGPRNPYNGDYFAVASSFQPEFDPNISPLQPESYVHGVVVNGQPKAYLTDALYDGMTDIVGGERIFVSITDNRISFFESNAEEGVAPKVIDDKEGFWFSWQAAHPDTLLYSGETI